MSHFNVSLIVWAKSQDSVHKPQFLKRREGRAEADRTEVLLLTSLAPYRWATPAYRLSTPTHAVNKVVSVTHEVKGETTCLTVSLVRLVRRPPTPCCGDKDRNGNCTGGNRCLASSLYQLILYARHSRNSWRINVH